MRVVACETGFSCLFRLGVQNAVYADIGAVRRRNLVDGPTLPIARLAALAGEFGLSAQRARLDWQALHTRPFAHPLVLILANSNAVILMGVRRGGAAEVAICDPLFRDGEIFFLSRAELEKSWRGETLIVAPLPPSREDAKFGFSWFTRKLFAERRLIRDVVIAALAMHLIALSVPIFFQILVDKVVPNQAFSTLYTITAGVFVLVLFDGGFNYMRNYLLGLYHPQARPRHRHRHDRPSVDPADRLFPRQPVGRHRLQTAGSEQRPRFSGEPAVQHLSRLYVGGDLFAGLADLFMATDVDRARGVGHRLCRAGGHVARVPPQIARRQRHRRAAQGVFIRDPERHRHDQDPGARTALAVALAPLYRRGGGQDPDARPYRGTRPQRDHEPRTRHERRHRRARRAVRAQRQDDGRRADRLQHAGFAAGAAADPGLRADAGVPKGGAVAETAWRS